MSVGSKPSLDLPKEPDDRLRAPQSPAFGKGDTVQIRGFIGLVTEHFVHLHHMLDHRAYYQIPIEGIASCGLESSGAAGKVYKLEVHEETPIRYFHATTVDLTAGILAHAVDTYNRYAKRPAPKEKRKPLAMKEPQDCPITCQVCIQGVCVHSVGDFPMGASHLEMYGLTLSTPAHPAKP